MIKQGLWDSFRAVEFWWFAIGMEGIYNLRLND
jgi:hypothetical protein